MPTTQTPLFDPLLNVEIETLLFLIKIAILIILIFYAIFSLLIVRQVDLMSKTLISSVSPIVKAFSIVNAGIALGLILLVWGIL